MKHLRRILPLLLTALLMLTLLPTAALADPPPYDDYGTYHEWVISDQRGPTCEDYGYTTWTCSVCGQTWTEYSGAPLGHDWDEGELLRDPEGFTAGAIIYTCKNDPSHTREEPINPVPALIAAFEGHLPPPVLTSNLPRITLQPVGGLISRGGSDGHTMTVAAEGGVPPYTYEWHYTDNGGSIDLNEDAVSDVLKSSAAFSAGAAFEAQSNWLAAMGEAWADLPEADWVKEASEDVLDAAYGPDMLGGRSSGKLGGGEPSYTAHAGNCSYYCVVYDDAGQKAVSDTVRVDYALRVRTQPENTNLPLGGYAELVCAGGDGTGNYTYTWMSADGGTAEGTATEPGHFRVEKTGDYFCVVSDGREEIASDTVTVYEAETLVELAWSKDVLKWPEESVELYAAFEGGTPPYTAEWRSNGTTVSTVQSEEPYFTITVDDFEPYHCYVEDSMGQKAHVYVHADERHLNITKQPVGGYLPKGGTLELSIEVEGGEGYLHYVLIQDDVVRVSNSEGKFNVGAPGVYCIGVYDRKAHWAKSLPVSVEDDDLRISDQSESAVITDPAQGVNIFVEAEGGTRPYTYRWYTWRTDILHGTEFCEAGANSGTINVKVPGSYYCCVDDKDGNTVISDYINVSYAGDAPLITLQPNDIYFEYSEQSQIWALFCDAIPGQGGNADDLIFEWYYMQPGFTAFTKLGAVDAGTGGRMLPDIYYPGSGGYSPTRNCGWYYCKVTDTATGKSTDSRTAMVDVALSITQATFSPFSHYADCGTIYYTFQGGCGPYTVEFIANWQTSDLGTTMPVHMSTTTLQDGDPKDASEKDLPKMHDFVDCTQGQPEWRRQFITYYIVITDALGQRTEYHDPDLRYFP